MSLPELWVQCTGAAGDGDRNSVQAALDDAAQSGATVGIHGPCALNHASLYIRGGIELRGTRGAKLVPAADVNAIVVQTEKSISLSQLAISYPDNNVAGDAIVFSPPGGGSYNTNSVIRDVRISKARHGVVAIDALLMKLYNLSADQFSGVGAMFGGTINADAGDHELTSCDFISGKPSTVGVQSIAAGGIRLLGGKMLGVARGFELKLGAGTAHTGSSQISIVGTSIELTNPDSVAIALTRVGGCSDQFVNVNICGVEMYSRIGVLAYDYANGNDSWLQNLPITGCNWQATGPNSVFTSLQGVRNANVCGNTLQNQGFASVYASINGPHVYCSTFGPNNKSSGPWAPSHLPGVDIRLVGGPNCY